MTGGYPIQRENLQRCWLPYLALMKKFKLSFLVGWRTEEGFSCKLCKVGTEYKG